MTWPIMTSWTSSAGTFERLSASRMAMAPSSGALNAERAPRNFPIGVLAAPTITGVRDLSDIVTSLIELPSLKVNRRRKGTHMNELRRQSWLGPVILLGLVYFAIGLAFGALAGSAASSQMRVTWRLSAWLLSAIAFAAHIWYEHFRRRSPRVATAFHAALAV